MSRLIVTASLIALLAIPAVTTTSVAATPKCDGKPATIVGTNRSERIIGTRRADVIVARRGDDKIFGRGGADRICAGGGKDVVDGEAGNDRIFGDAGDDTLRGSGGADRVAGGPGKDAVAGGSGDDVLLGDDGNDTIDGEVGIDVARGGSGADDVRGGDGDDRLFGDSGDDVLLGEVGDDDLDGGFDSDRCDQGPGLAGAVLRCETADLSVKVDGPGDGAPANSIIDYSLEIKNAGPDAASYTLELSYDTNNVVCTPTSDWVGSQRGASLPATENHDVFVSLSCGAAGGASSAWVTAVVIANATDPVSANDEHTFSVAVLP